MKKRSYKVTFGLKEGYTANGKVHTMDHAEQIIKNWMAARLKNELPVVSGFLQLGVLVYPSVDGEKNNGPVTSSESALFSGDLSSEKDAGREDSEVKHTLEDLAHSLKIALKQESVFIIYRKKNWCV